MFITVISSLTSCTAGAPFYLVKQGYGQARILFSRVSVDQLIEENQSQKETIRLTDDQIEKLIFMKQIRQYAKDQWHLKDTDSFQSYVKTDGDSVSYLVMAAPPLKLEPKRWWFPIVGEVPYLGFFDIKDADSFEKYLQAESYDTYRGGAAAYSTLGWFSDPVFSSQLAYSKLYLCGLVVHEMVHSTIWVKGYPEFNEAIASFIEDKAREAYFQEIEGANSQTLQRWHSYNRDVVKLNQIIDTYQTRLNNLYESNITDEIKQAEKTNLFNELKNSLRSSKSQFQIIDTSELADQEWNNARLTSRSVYRSDWPQFEAVFNECSQSIHCFIQTYSDLSKNLKQNANQFVRPNS
ncbi:MAG: aminopeptidase [Leptonema sp. (in: Bacteria)]|nr:aminopeptidase [Leptonema sp. (in: bacteria)]